MLLLDEPADLGQRPLAGLVRAAEDEVHRVAGDLRSPNAVAWVGAAKPATSCE